VKTQMNLTGPEQGDESVEVLVVYRDCDEPSVAPWVSAEELHAFLAVPQDFLSWAEIQIRRGPFIEGTDYIREQRRAQPHPELCIGTGVGSPIFI